jgi:hypothetical protein
MPCPRSRWTAPVNPRHPPPDALADETEPVVVRRAAFGGHALHGEGTLWRAIYPDLAGSRRLFVGLAEFAPGTAPHVFHRRGSEVVGAPGARRRLTYAAGAGGAPRRAPDPMMSTSAQETTRCPA